MKKPIHAKITEPDAIDIRKFIETYNDWLNPSQIKMLERFEDLTSLEITGYDVTPLVVVHEIKRSAFSVYFKYTGQGISGSFALYFNK